MQVDISRKWPLQSVSTRWATNIKGFDCVSSCTVSTPARLYRLYVVFELFALYLSISVPKTFKQSIPHLVLSLSIRTGMSLKVSDWWGSRCLQFTGETHNVSSATRKINIVLLNNIVIIYHHHHHNHQQRQLIFLLTFTTAAAATATSRRVSQSINLWVSTNQSASRSSQSIKSNQSINQSTSKWYIGESVSQ